jgi:nucleoside-diphosphate-sugar epimerase
MTRALVTGATGFIGSHLTEFLMGLGWEVVCLGRDPFKPRHIKDLTVRIISLNQIRTELEKAPGFDYIFHLAGATREKNYEGYARANLNLTEDLLKSIVDSGNNQDLKRFLFVSSQAAAGPAKNPKYPVKEEDPASPVSLYGKSKLEAENLVKGFSGSVPITIIRPPTVFGPRDTDLLTVFRMCKYRTQTVPRGLEQHISVIYVKDLVNGIFQAATTEVSIGETYFIANERPVVWRQFCLDISEVCGKRSVILPVPILIMNMIGGLGDLSMRFTGKPPLIRSEKLREMLQPAWVCSSEKAAAQLKWAPEYSLREALIETMAWYRSQGWI